jgi:DNA modification methylase
MDCLEAMKKMPDNAFDLACVDPPYGDGSSQSVQVEREREK